MNAPKGKQVHHKNGDSLDNTRGNLEIVTDRQHDIAKRKKDDVPF